MGFAAIARVTTDRWVACASRDELAFGLGPGDEIPIETTICDLIRKSGDLVVINDVAADEAWRDHFIPALYGFRSYISVPIQLPDGSFFGTLCALDPQPRKVSTAQVIGLFQLCAEFIGINLDLATQLDRSRTALVSAREIAKLREEFIAVVGHDLRNPVAALTSGLRLMADGKLKDPQCAMVELQGILFRMSSLIDNLEDFTRGRLGGPMTLNIAPKVALKSVIESVATEVELASRRQVEKYLDLPEWVTGDSGKIGQLLSNLLTNAVSHGDPNGRILIRAVTQSSSIQIDVISDGKPIPDRIRHGIFDPYVRGDTATTKGIGLGLHIASQIAAAHGGRLSVEPEPGGNRFSLLLPYQVEPSETGSK